MSDQEPIAVIGAGYVGLVTAAGFAELGSEVWCVDIDADRVARLQAGEVPIHEPGLEELLAGVSDRLHFSTELAPAVENARLVLVAVGTPPTYSGDADLGAVHAVVAALPAGGAGEHAIVMKSTVPVGTGAAIVRELERQGKAGYGYVSCPEFLREGSALGDFRAPARVVVGDDGGWAGDAVVELYRRLDAPLVRTDVASAEMVKLASNAFLATKISFINEIANVCEETGADVTEVARGMGLDDRIGHSFLNAGLGYGGSCLPGDETVLVRHDGRTTLLSFEALWRRLEAFGEVEDDGVIEPQRLEVLSWVPGEPEPMFLEVMCVTRREYEGDVVDVRTKMGRRVTTTSDHPWIVSDGRGAEPERKLAADLTSDDWVPLALGRAGYTDRAGIAALLGAAEAAELSPDQLIVRPERRHIDAMARDALPAPRRYDVRRTGALRLDEAALADVPLRGATFGTARNGNFVPGELPLDEAFWRIVGSYIAEGHVSVERGRHRISWSFHPTHEQHLVDEVMAFWMRLGVRALVHESGTSKMVTVSSRLLGAWWLHVLGLGRTSYEQRLPDLIWDRPDEDKWALLSRLWEGDGSWSLVNGGPSVILEMGTISDELADGVLRLLGDLGIVASRRVGRAAKSTKDTHWLRVSGADQVERAIALVPERDREGVRTSMGLQRERIAPTGYRIFDEGPAWVRVVGAQRRRFRGSVYSLEVPGSHTFAATGGLINHNCFPKDVSALKQLAGNSGYHFQLLGAVIEVNELQKRRVIGKLQKHLGPLRGKRIALLGLAFKPGTDDVREAPSLVLASRLLAEGAEVSTWDPVASAHGLLPMARQYDSIEDAVGGAHAAVIVTEWPQLADLATPDIRDRMATPLIIDGRNLLDPAKARAAGFGYEGIGRPNHETTASAPDA
jgi:UDPglucose 6-dehydrogenase